VSAGAELVLDGVTVTYGATSALAEVCLRIAPGDSVAFVGPSGAGKTTLLRLCNGTLRPDRGSVLIDGAPIEAMSVPQLRQVRAAIGFIPQDLCLVPNIRVAGNVLMGRLGRQSLWRSLRAQLLPPRRDIARAHALLERVGIGDKLYQRTDKLSGGQRQRVAIARALYPRPRAILADEPVSSVDPARAKDTVELLTAISTEHELTLGMSLHNIELARACFPRLIGLRAGRIVFDAPAGEVGDAEFRALYDLAPEQMMADGG